MDGDREEDVGGKPWVVQEGGELDVREPSLPFQVNITSLKGERTWLLFCGFLFCMKGTRTDDDQGRREFIYICTPAKSKWQNRYHLCGVILQIIPNTEFTIMLLTTVF